MKKDRTLSAFMKQKDALLSRRGQLEEEISTIDAALNGAAMMVKLRASSTYGKFRRVAKAKGKRGSVAESVRAFLKKKGGATYGEVVKAFDDRHARALGSMFAKKKLKRKGDKYVLLAQ